MNLRHLSDQDLLSATERIVQQERAILTSLLHHLREVGRRRLYADLKYGSLFEYTVKKLGYPEDQAARRLAAMRLLQELPEIEEKISSGALNLTQLGMARSFFKREEKAEAQTFSRQEKIELLQELENKSVRESEKTVLARSSSPVTVKPDKIRPLTEELVEIQFVADEALQKKIEKLKNLKSHKNPNMSLAELLHELCDLALNQWDPIQTATSRSKERKLPSKKTSRQVEASKANTSFQRVKTLVADKASISLQQIDAFMGEKKNGECQFVPSLMSNKSKALAFMFKRKTRPYLPVTLKRELWRRDQGCCRQCGSRYQIEIDHIRPHAKGGLSNLQNLRLLCRSCNQRAALLAFGLKKMEAHLEK